MITQEQIQLIVDGECSHEDRVILLHKMESEPSAWRSLALSLLEEQEWSRQVKAIVKGRPCLSVAATHEQPTIMRSGKSQGKSHAKSTPWLSALAASLLLGFGFYGGSYLPRPGVWDSQSGNSQSGSGDQVAVIADPRNRGGVNMQSIDRGDSSDTNMRMLVSGPNSETAEIPIYDLNGMDHDVFVAKQAYEVARINQRLRKEGFELDVRPEYYTGKLHDGRQLIVPVKHVGLKPYGL